MAQMLQLRLSPSSSSHNKKNTHSFTTLNCPCPPLFRKIPFGFRPPCALLLSLNRPLSISCLPPSRTWLFLAIASGFCPTRLSIAWLKVPRRVSPAPCTHRVSACNSATEMRIIEGLVHTCIPTAAVLRFCRVLGCWPCPCAEAFSGARPGYEKFCLPLGLDGLP